MRPLSLGIIIPTFNDEKSLLDFLPSLTDAIEDITEASHTHIIIIDDGSKKHFYLDSKNLRLKKTEVTVLRHPVNLGQGAAIQTGVEYLVKLNRTDLFFTMDADGQHSPSDIAKMMEIMKSGNFDIAFGNRFSNTSTSNVPFIRKYILKLAILFEKIVTGLDLSDAHNGFRCFNTKFASQLALRQNRMAHATEFKQIVHQKKFTYTEVPVSIKYTKETLAKGQSGLNSISIVKELLTVYLFDRI